MSTRRFTGERVKIPTMPWATQPALIIHTALNRALAERTALVRAAIVHCRILTIKMNQRDLESTRRDRFDTPVIQFIRARNSMPDNLVPIAHKCLVQLRFSIMPKLLLYNPPAGSFSIFNFSYCGNCGWRPTLDHNQ
jgi:uncharacterized membrane protein